MWLLLALVQARVVREGGIGFFKCPATTHPSMDAKGNHLHCICPKTHICDGCERGCTNPKQDLQGHLQGQLQGRCVAGFKPSCHSCRCHHGKLYLHLALLTVTIT